MAFNLKKVLKALLFSSSDPLSVKDIQTAFARFHERAAQPVAGKAAAGDAAAGGEEAEAVAEESPAAENAAGEAEVADGFLLSATDSDAELYRDVPSLITATQIREAMDAIAAELRAADDVYLLIDGASGYRMVTHPRFARWVRIQRDEPPPVKLTQSAMETLSVVAYRQPVTRTEIETIRGVSVEGSLGRLAERDLIYVVGRADLPGRPLQYGTTDKFLEFVGVKSLVELPASDVLSPRQIDDWLKSATTVKPPADAEMGLPLEEGEGVSPNLETVEVASVEAAPPEVAQPAAATASEEAPSVDPSAETDAPETHLSDVIEEPSAPTASSEDEDKPASA